MAAQTVSALDTKSVFSPPETSKTTPNLDIIDIRSTAVELNLKEEIHALFKPKHGPRTLPTLLLYNERGLQIFEQVTRNPYASSSLGHCLLTIIANHVARSHIWTNTT